MPTHKSESNKPKTGGKSARSGQEPPPTGKPDERDLISDDEEAPMEQSLPTGPQTQVESKPVKNSSDSNIEHPSLDIVHWLLLLNLIVTAILFGDMWERKTNLSANTPDEQIITLGKRVSNIESSLQHESQTTSGMDTRLSNVELKCDDAERQLRQISEVLKVKNDIDLINSRLEKLEGILSLKMKLDSAISRLQDQEELQERVTIVEETLKDYEQKTANEMARIEAVEAKVETVKREHNEYKDENARKLFEMENGIERVKDDLNNHIQKMELNLTMYMETINSLIFNMTLLQGMNNATLGVFLRNEHATLAFAMQGIVDFIFLILVVLLLRDRHKFEGESNYALVESSHPPTHVSRENISSRSILDRIQPQTLMDEVCVISFYTETQSLHRRLATSVLPDGKKMTTAVVEKHQSILTLPRSKIFLVFVDFNERNIILEDPEREIGDLKLTTVQGALKFGGKVYVIYVRDNGSKNLPEGQIINKKLTSIYSHSVLKSLNQQERVLTTYDEFTQYQRQHVIKMISRG